MKTISHYFSDSERLEYEQDTGMLFVWDEDKELLGSIELTKESMSDLIDFLTDVYKELK